MACMIASSIRDALGQMGDPRFRWVLAQGIGLTIALLIGASVLVFQLVQWVFPDVVTLPWIGQITFAEDIFSWGSVAVMMVLSVFLMVPVASAFTGLFLDDVADAVEAEHYAHLPPAPRTGFLDGIREAAGFLIVLIVANIAALAAYLVFAPFAPLIFYALNGYLLGREYFRMIALRRLGRAGARSEFKQHLPTVWIAGALMAVPLTVPVINLLVPVLGAATFTHLFHRLGR
jgi:uncharacterized protein involved in cysteine biosynthesis